MILYYSPGACALGVQIALREANMHFELRKTDIKQHKTVDGQDFYKINPKGYVPTLQIDSHTILTEASVILQWIADQVPEKRLLPSYGTKERYQAMEWLNFIASELHKGIGLQFSAIVDQNSKDRFWEKTKERIDFTNRHLSDHLYLTGSSWSVVDAYLFNIIRWSVTLKKDMSAFTALEKYMNEMSTRPSVTESLRGEGFKV